MRPSCALRALRALPCLLLPPLALANHPGSADAGPQTIIVEGHYDNTVGSSDAASAGVIRAGLLASRPALRTAEVLEFVPGVVVTQHSGDGKANQYFLRGFNLDHGTDFAVRVAGMPVNLGSHGHGQGYSDLNFLIPELVGRIEYRKGPYFATAGDFAAAGSADIVYRDRGLKPFVQATLGQDGYRRGLAGGSGALAGGVGWLGAVEAQANDGPWTVPQRARKANGVFTLSSAPGATTWSASAMHYDARWTATDQVPERALDAGRIGRYDSLDPTDGGRTRRSSLSAQFQHDGAAGRTRVSAYAIRYALELFSNFTYVLERPADGDQFAQTDRRSVWGADASHAVSHDLGSWPARSEFGLQWRHDRARVGLFDSVARRVTATLRDDEVTLAMASAYAQTSVEPADRWRVVAGLRLDHLDARVDALTLAANGGRASGTQLSPKLSVIHTLTPKTELFANAGRGFHSNDARGMTARFDPRTGDPVDAVPPLVAVRGAELGLRSEAVAGLQTSVALWALRSGSELIYVGDAGGTDASQASRRAGIEWNNRWAPMPWLLVDADLAVNRARLADGGRIPGAVERVVSMGVTLRDVRGWTASLHGRYLGPSALTEDNRVRGRSSFITSLRVSRHLGANASATLDVFNLFDRKADDIQYFYASRLPGEAAGVEDRHLHPAEPRRIRLTLQVAF